MRITQQFQTQESLFGLQESLLRRTDIQEQIASGRSVNHPSDDPVLARSGMISQSTLEEIGLFVRNIQNAVGQLTMTESAMQDINQHLINARNIAISEAQGTATTETRRASGIQIQQMLTAVIDLGNTQFDDRFIFGGRRNTTAPFVKVGNGVEYLGDDDDLLTNIAEGIQIASNVSGAEAFGVLSTKVQGADLNPQLSFGGGGVVSTRTADLNRGEGIASGSIQIAFGPAASRSTVTVDLSQAVSIADLRDLIEDATGNAVTVSINAGNGLALTDTTFDTAEMVVSDVNGNTAAADLGIAGTSTAGVLSGGDLDPAISLSSSVLLLLNSVGAPVDMAGGLRITNGTFTDTLDLSSAATVEDILNLFAQSSAHVQARINDNATGIDVISTISGTTLTIEEDAGTTAGDFGIEETAGVTSDSIFSALINLADALLNDDTLAISQAGQALEARIDDLINTRGELGVRIQRLQLAENRHQNEELTVQQLLSESLDADLAAVLTKLSTEEVVFNAILRSIASTFQPSLMEFL